MSFHNESSDTVYQYRNSWQFAHSFIEPKAITLFWLATTGSQTIFRRGKTNFSVFTKIVIAFTLEHISQHIVPRRKS